MLFTAGRFMLVSAVRALASARIPIYSVSICTRPILSEYQFYPNTIPVPILFDRIVVASSTCIWFAAHLASPSVHCRIIGDALLYLVLTSLPIPYPIVPTSVSNHILLLQSELTLPIRRRRERLSRPARRISDQRKHFASQPKSQPSGRLKIQTSGNQSVLDRHAKGATRANNFLGFAASTS